MADITLEQVQQAVLIAVVEAADYAERLPNNKRAASNVRYLVSAYEGLANAKAQYDSLYADPKQVNQ